MRFFPGLDCYFQPCEQGLVGVGGLVACPGKLVNVPIHVGTGPVDPDTVVCTTFYVPTNNTQYALILSRTLLHSVEGLLDLKYHWLQYIMGIGPHWANSLPLSTASHQPIYRQVAQCLHALPATSMPPAAVLLTERTLPAPEGAEAYLPPALHALVLAPSDNVPMDDPLWSPA